MGCTRGRLLRARLGHLTERLIYKNIMHGLEDEDKGQLW